MEVGLFGFDSTTFQEGENNLLLSLLALYLVNGKGYSVAKFRIE